MTKKSGVVVLLEGSEQCGKTTLADKIHSRFKADYLHGDRPTTNSFEEFHKNMLEAATVMAADGHVVILDRCFISHEVYGELFDGGAEYDTRALCDEFVDALADVQASLFVVYCRPKREFDPNMREEMYDDSDGKIQDKFDEVFGDYTGNGDYSEIYDWTKDPSGEEILKTIEELQKAYGD